MPLFAREMCEVEPLCLADPHGERRCGAASVQEASEGREKVSVKEGGNGKGPFYRCARYPGYVVGFIHTGCCAAFSRVLCNSVVHGCIGVVTCQKRPITVYYCSLPVTGPHCGPNGKRACFFPVLFRRFESLSVVTAF